MKKPAANHNSEGSLERGIFASAGNFAVSRGKDIGIPLRRINEIVHGLHAINLDMAVRLGKYFGVSAQSWLNL